MPDQSAEPLIRNLLRGNAGSLTLTDFGKLLQVPGMRWAEATAILGELQQRDLQPSAPQWQRHSGRVLAACETDGLWHKALSLLETMAIRRLEVNHIGEMASGWRVKGGAGTAAGRSANFGRLPPGLRKIVVMRLYTAKDRKDAADVAIAAATLRSYGAPKPRDYVVLLSAYGEVHLWESALDVLQEMERMDFAPYIVSYNAALMACEKGGQWCAALALFHDMPKVALPPDKISYTTLIRNVGQQKLWENALHLLANMDEEQTMPDVVVYSAAMTACARARRWWLALKLLAELPSRELFPDEVPGPTKTDPRLG